MNVSAISMNQRLAAAGVRTVRIGGQVFLTRNGVMTPRPHVENCEAVCLSMFNVVI